MVPWLGRQTPFPPAHKALREPNGLLAAGGDLSPQRLLDAYSHGIFPWFGEGEPILWWSPDPRMVLFPEELAVSRSLAKKVRNSAYEIRFDTRFDEVLERCAEPRPGQPGTWITPEMRVAYNRLHAMGFAHSAETWIGGELVGGLYGVALGGVFFGESMFSRRSDASKLAFVALVDMLKRDGFEMIDCQVHTTHLESLGARNIARVEFLRRLGDLLHYPRAPGSWSARGFVHASGRKSV